MFATRKNYSYVCLLVGLIKERIINVLNKISFGNQYVHNSLLTSKANLVYNYVISDESMSTIDICLIITFALYTNIMIIE